MAQADLPTSSPMPPSRTPRIEGRYAIYDRIAAGGIASVHYGRQRGPAGFSRSVAVKMLHPQLAADPAVVDMLRDEARLAARVLHPNVVSTLDVVEAGGEVLLILEYVHGESLARLVDAARGRGERVPVAIAVAIASGILQGLHAAHEATSDDGRPLHLVHRDVSPQNVIVGADGVARVADFGIAKAANRARTTREGELKGKMPYMAPEQLRDAASVDRRADVWAAAVILWEMLTGQSLFRGESDAEIFGRVLYDKIPPPSSVAEEVPRALDAVLKRSLDRHPERRFATATEMAASLEACVRTATAAETARWVGAIAEAQLRDRAARLAAIEAHAVPAGEDGAPAKAGARRRAAPAFAVVALIALGAALGGFAVAARARTPADAAPSSPAPPEEAPVASVPALAAPSASSGAVAASGSGGASPALRPVAGARPRRTAPRSAPSARDVDHDPRCFTLDDAGIWHVKPQCL